MIRTEEDLHVWRARPGVFGVGDSHGLVLTGAEHPWVPMVQIPRIRADLCLLFGASLPVAGAVLGVTKGLQGSALFFLWAAGIHRPKAMPGLGHGVI